MTTCFWDTCPARGTKDKPLLIVADRLGASYGGFTVYACPAHACLYKADRPVASGWGVRG